MFCLHICLLCLCVCLSVCLIVCFNACFVRAMGLCVLSDTTQIVCSLSLCALVCVWLFLDLSNMQFHKLELSHKHTLPTNTQHNTRGPGAQWTWTDVKHKQKSKENDRIITPKYRKHETEKKKHFAPPITILLPSCQVRVVSFFACLRAPLPSRYHVVTPRLPC